MRSSDAIVWQTSSILFPYHLLSRKKGSKRTLFKISSRVYSIRSIFWVFCFQGIERSDQKSLHWKMPFVHDTKIPLALISALWKAATALCAKQIRSTMVFMCSFHLLMCSFHSVMRSFHLVVCSFHSVMCSFHYSLFLCALFMHFLYSLFVCALFMCSFHVLFSCAHAHVHVWCYMTQP